MFNDPFAEIEIKSEEPAIPGQKITSSGLDPVREKFYDMRSMAPNNPDAWQDVKLFYRQGRFMEDFTDDYEQITPLSMYSPSYQRLGYDQLRTYFTWRTKVWQGQYSDISHAYVFLYIYELLSGIGVNDPEDGLYKLVGLWKAYQERLPTLDDYVPSWLKDYHVYYELPHTFGEFVERHNLRPYYVHLTMFDLNQDTALDDWLAVGSYDISKSKFYKDNSELMRVAFHAGVSAIDVLCRNIGRALEDLFYFKSSPISWYPFEEAMFYSPTFWEPQVNKEVYISPYEVYICYQNRWTAHKKTPYKHKDDLIGYFVKIMEQHLREIIGFKSSFFVSVNKLSSACAILEGMGTSLAELSQLLHDKAKEAHYELTRIVVNVDKSNLVRIREEAEVTQDKLIVAEAEVLLCDTRLGASTGQALAFSTTEEISSESSLPQPPGIKELTGQDSNDTKMSSPWVILKAALTATELAALQIAIINPENIKSFAMENDIMPEILADGINEKAMDSIGDNILEYSDVMAIYDEYIHEIENLFENL